MARYCFAERQQELFNEALVRGWLAAILDFPHHSPIENRTMAAEQVCDEMQAEVCCITASDAYRQLIMSGWISAYVAVVRDLTEREIVYQKGALARASTEEARAVLRRGMSESETVKAAWTQFCALAR